jgi:hypothetical protein
MAALFCDTHDPGLAPPPPRASPRRGGPVRASPDRFGLLLGALFGWPMIVASFGGLFRFDLGSPEVQAFGYLFLSRGIVFVFHERDFEFGSLWVEADV